MIRRRCHNPNQIDLLGWEPSAPVAAFAPPLVRAASLAASIAKAIALTLRECALSRAEVAAEMSTYLGESVGENMLNAYSSEARESHIINVVRFVALIHATGDRRLLQMIADRFDWAVIDRKYLPAIELAELNEKQAELNRRAEVMRRQLRAGGVL